jgi:hypothetical protein
LVVWGAPLQPDIEQVVQAIHSARLEYGAPVLYIARVPKEAPAPDRNTRKLIDRALPEFLANCSSYHVVMEGEGFFAALKRSVLTSTLLPSWRRRMFYVHAHCSDVGPAVTAPEQTACRQLFELAQQQGLLHGPLAETVIQAHP